MLRAALGGPVRTWIQGFNTLRFLSLVLLYLQVGCSFIDSLGVSYTGVLLANLIISLFALVAIATGNQTLGRVYAMLLALGLSLDIAWFVCTHLKYVDFNLNSVLATSQLFRCS